MTDQQEDTSHQLEVDDAESNQIGLLQKGHENDKSSSKMADQQLSTSHQQDHGENDGETTQGHSIVANHDCLEHIFMRMGIETLLTVAHSSKLFQTLAVSVFKQKFGKKLVGLKCSRICEDFWNRERGELCIHPLKVIFPFLRVFGAEISKLRVHYQSHEFYYSNLDKSKRWSIDSMMRRIDEYINMYCADTLVRFDIQHKLKFSNDFPKPFKKIEDVRVHSTHLYDNLLRFVDWFPNMQHFEVNAECIDHCFSDVTFPHLKHLTILFGYPWYEPDDEKIVQMKNADELLKANQQLHTVELLLYFCFIGWDCVKIKHLLDMITDNRRLTKIVFGMHSLSDRRIEKIGAAEANRIVMEHPELVELELNNYHEIEADDAISIVRGLNSLKKFRLIVNEFEYQKFIDQLSSEWEYTSQLSNADLKHYSIDLHRK